MFSVITFDYEISRLQRNVMCDSAVILSKELRTFANAVNILKSNVIRGTVPEFKNKYTPLQIPQAKDSFPL